MRNSINSDQLNIIKNLGIEHNVCIRVIDEASGQVVSEHIGHNTATNSLLVGMGHYLCGEGVFQQGETLSQWVPKYISLGTMGLINQDQDAEGLPAGIGSVDGSEEDRFISYMDQCPGYGSDGYDLSLMNNRPYPGLGPTFTNRPDQTKTINCELITDSFKRSPITFRDIVPEYQSEHPKTIDVVFSAYVSTGALASFRDLGNDYIFITEVGLWSKPTWTDGGDNGLLAGYRICPPDSSNWNMRNPENREILKKNIIKIKVNQVAQIIWKIQLGSLAQLGGYISGDEEWVIRM